MTALFSRKNLTNYISPEIQVGFCQFGPTLMIGGILTATKGVCLIDHISASITTPFNSLKKEFDWFTLQPHSALDARFELYNAPSKFILSPDNPYTYNILFTDNLCYAEMKTVMLNISSAWQFFLEKNKDQPYEKIYTEFISSSIHREFPNMLKQFCYWRKGSYKIELSVAAKGEVFVEQKSFELKEDDIVPLLENSADIMAGICNQPSVNFNSVKTTLS